MSLLDANAEGLAAAATNSFRPPPTPAAGAKEPGLFKNFAETSGRYFMRSMAEAGRAIDMAGAAFPVIADKIVGGTDLQEQYFREHDEMFNRAVDYWTPKPQEAGAAGQVVGSLAGGIVQFLANPALMVSTAQLGTAEDLVRQGVDADAAILAGDVAALATVAGIKIPVAGSTLTQRLLAGAGGNLVTSVPEAALKREIVEAAGAPKVAEQFDPFDPRGRAVDVLLGLAFGAKAHWDARRIPMDASQIDAVMTANAARHIEEASAPGRAVDPNSLTASVEATRTAIDQISRGEPVNVPRTAGEFIPDPAREAFAAEMEPIVREAMGDFEAPIPRPDMQAMIEPKPEVEAKQGETKQEGPRFADDVMVPSGKFDDATGEAKMISANEAVARAQAEVETTKATALRFMETAAACLLGGV